VVVEVKRLGAAPQAGRRAVPVRVTEPLLVLSDFVHVDRDDGATVVAVPPRLDEARVRRRRPDDRSPWSNRQFTRSQGRPENTG
jgi:hypothetical protein